MHKINELNSIRLELCEKNTNKGDKAVKNIAVNAIKSFLNNLLTKKYIIKTVPKLKSIPTDLATTRLAPNMLNSSPTKTEITGNVSGCIPEGSS